MRFIDEHSHLFAVALLLRVLNIAESTYYQWVRRAEQPSDRDLVDLGLISKVGWVRGVVIHDGFLAVSVTAPT